ncbi:LLM class flavin-dependent oxidoreductase [Agromyces sp. LHK192]|uniref:LLM class flavin-dependent oxidoreductase n=1 Tax=Agromyces sp. LHK192 TaxID=2498704 RepID=UPI000FDB06CD|nr:LLM class flavin-dependent oxidoreductase [Agromyces sp. LHK192]
MTDATAAPSAVETGRVGVMLPRDLPVADVLPFARRAEALGFDELWVVEDLGFRGGFAQAAAVLGATERIEVGIGILPAAARLAAFAAMEIATLEQLFPGRVIVGLGHGMPQWMRQLGAWPASPLTLLRETTLTLRALLAGEPAPDGGRYIEASGLVLDERPERVPPILLGVRGPRSLELAGEVADGVVLAEPADPTYIEASIAHVERGAATAGRSASAPRVVTYDVAAVAETDAAAFARVRPALAWFGEPDWAPHLAGLPFAADLAELRKRAGSPAAFAEAIPDEWIARLALAGTAERVRELVAERHRAGATTVVLTPVGDDRLGELERLAAAR